MPIKFHTPVFEKGIHFQCIHIVVKNKLTKHVGVYCDIEGDVWDTPTLKWTSPTFD